MVRILLELIYPMYNNDRNFIHKLLLKGNVLDQMGTLTLKKSVLWRGRTLLIRLVISDVRKGAGPQGYANIPRRCHIFRIKIKF